MTNLGDLTGKWKTKNGSIAVVEGNYDGKYVGKIDGVTHFWNGSALCDYDHGLDLMERELEGNYPPIRSGQVPR